MVKFIYKRILKKLSLSREELIILRKNLISGKVCAGPFIDGDLMCPNTLALSIKIKGDNINIAGIRKEFHDLGVTWIELGIFYLVYDIPAMISRIYANESLFFLKKAVDELLYS